MYINPRNLGLIYEWMYDVLEVRGYTDLEPSVLSTFDNPLARKLIKSRGDIQLVGAASLVYGTGHKLSIETATYMCDGAYTIHQVIDSVNAVTLIMLNLPRLSDADSEYITAIGIAEDHTVDLVYNSDRVLARKTIDDRFIAHEEAAHMALLRGCTNVAQLISVEFAGEVGVLFIEACNRAISRGLPLGIPVNEMWRQLAVGLQCIHEHRILHFDIKPDNILVCGDQLAITDFGLAENYTEGKRYSSLVYSTMCRPPELNALWLLPGTPETFKASYTQDVYALGATFYYIANKHEDDEDNLKSLHLGEITQEEYDELDRDYYFSRELGVISTLIAQIAISPAVLVADDPITHVYPELARILPTGYPIVVEDVLLRRMLDSAPSLRPGISEVVDELSSRHA